MNWRSLEWVGKKVIPAAMCGLLAVVAAQSIPACSTSNSATETPTGTTGTSGAGSSTGTTTTDACAHPNPGCGCSQAGETAPCGRVIIQSGDFFQCSLGTTTCDGTTWGTCDGEIKTQGNTISGGGVAIRGYGGPIPCGSQNACDPFCAGVTDTSNALDAGAHLSTGDAGLSIAFTGTPANVCNEPSTTSTVVTNDFASSNASSYRHSLPAGSSAAIACSGGGTASDTCPFDYYCKSSNVCAPWAQGTTNAGCGGAPDFTAGLGCWDNGANPNGLELQVCNRGGVSAATGTLYVDFSEAPATTTASGCGTATFPNLPPTVSTTTPSTGGYCKIPLTTSAIAPGACISFNVFSPANTTPSGPASGIQCYSSASGNPTLSTSNFVIGASSQIAVVVNPQALNGFTPSSTAATPLTECDACNNYTTISANSLGTAGAACVPSLCGTTAASGSGTSTCTTTLTGTVDDPGKNFGLSGVEVYLPTSAPTVPLPDEPALATSTPATLPSCSTCTSADINTPFTYGTVTGPNGSFSLSFPGNTGTTTIPYLVIQTGRWRRILTNFSVAGCTTNNLNAAGNFDTTRLPANSSEGDIPKMALVTGSQEALECWLLQVGISASEIVPYTTGDTHRIHIFQDNGQTTSPAAPTAASLFASGGPLNDYATVLFDCPTSSSPLETYLGSNPAAIAALENYTNAGGRVFMDHEAGTDWIGVNATNAPSTPAPWHGNNAIAQWQASMTPSGAPAQGKVLNASTSPDEIAFSQWAAVNDFDIGNTYPAGYIESDTPKEVATTVGAASVNLVQGETTNNWSGDPSGNYPLSFEFNTPVGSTTGYCGRVVFNDMHVSTMRTNNSISTSQVFPGNCVAPGVTTLTSEERALEYMFFQVNACNLGTTLPVTIPAPPTPLTATKFTRVYEAKCGAGYTPRWGFFEWKGTIPGNGASLGFQFQTAADATSGPGPYGPAVPATMFTQTVSSPTAWTIASPPVDGGGALSVDTMLQQASPTQTSQDYLTVTMTLTPNSDGSQAPDVYTWQQLYDCVP